jgi:hypothetical protein
MTLDVINNPPSTLAEWNALIKQEGLHVKWSEQLAGMYDSCKRKAEKLQQQHDPNYLFPYDVSEKVFRQEMTIEEAVALAQEQLVKYNTKIDYLLNICRLCEVETEIRNRLAGEGRLPATPEKYADGSVLEISEPLFDGQDLSSIERNPVGTTYYIDADSGSDSNDGLSTGAAWATANKFTESARSAGDVAIMRRNCSNTYDRWFYLFKYCSDGSLGNPIILEADYDNAFGEDVDVSSTATATVTVGSKTWTFTSDVSGSD